MVLPREAATALPHAIQLFFGFISVLPKELLLQVLNHEEDRFTIAETS